MYEYSLFLQMEQIKRANRLYTNDSIFLKVSLSIPVRSDLDLEQDGEGEKDNGHSGNSSGNKQDAGCYGEEEEEEGEERASDLTPVDFLKRLDDLIKQSKQVAVRGCEEAEERYDFCTLSCHTVPEALFSNC